MDAIRLPSRRAPFEFERDPSFKECHMDAFTDDQKVNYEELWRTWVHNGKLRQKATARKLTMVAAFVLGLVVIGRFLYSGVAK